LPLSRRIRGREAPHNPGLLVYRIVSRARDKARHG
jgi:hypothetical protein